MMWGDGPSGWWGWGMGLGSLLFLVLIVVVIVLLLRGPSTGSEPKREARSAKDILDERFARGDIDADEYRERRRTLEESGRG